MARIRTIKPEFPQSESMGRVSRDARLLFVELWTICDDSGKARAASRMLASLLFPYDDDAPGLIDGWLDELEQEGCIARYCVDGSTYLQVCNWLNHQKIDKPSQSKFPDFDESSRILANPRERSPLDQGPRTKDQGEEGKGFPTSSGAAAPPAATGQQQEQPPADPIFGTGLAMLVRKGVPEKSARSFLGLFRKTVGNDLGAAELLAAAERDDVSDPLAWLRRAAEQRKQTAKPAQVVGLFPAVSEPATPRRREFGK